MNCFSLPTGNAPARSLSGLAELPRYFASALVFVKPFMLPSEWQKGPLALPIRLKRSFAEKLMTERKGRETTNGRIPSRFETYDGMNLLRYGEFHV